MLGGLPSPRTRAEIVGGDGDDVLAGNARVVTERGVDVTAAYVAGAAAMLAVVRRHGATVAYLQDGSPSCGSTAINDGTFSKRRRSGLGVTAALLRSHGVDVRPI